MFRFDGLAETDFDAFQPSKWRSHAFNRERLEVKLKLTDLGADLDKRFAEKLSDQEMGLTPERPSVFNKHQAEDLTLYFLRNEQSRRVMGNILDQSSSMIDTMHDSALHHRHINLALRVHDQGAEVGLWIHENAWVDWKNMVQRCREYWEREKLTELLSTLPQTIMYVRGHPRVSEVKSVSQLDIDRILEGFSEKGPWSFFGEVLDRSDSILLTPELADRVESVFHSLIEFYQYICWRPDNDYQNLNELVKKEKQKAETKFTDLKPGDKVRIVKGLATGRIGVVNAIERKGKVKVRIGTMMVTMDLDELIASR